MLELKYAIFLEDSDYNELYDYIAKCNDKNERKTTESNLKKIGGFAAGSVLALLFPIPSAIASGAWLVREAVINHQGKKAKKKFDAMGDYAFYSLDCIPEEFSFETKPESRTVYVSCNYKPDYYYPLAAFPEKLAQIEEDAIWDMMKGLGAKTISWDRAVSDENSIDGTISFAKKNKVSYQESNKSGKEYEHEQSYPKPLEIKKSIHPYILDNRYWSKHQNERFEDRVTEAKYKWEIENEAGVGASVAESFTKAGFQIGGKYKSYNKTILKIHVSYWEF